MIGAVVTDGIAAVTEHCKIGLLGIAVAGLHHIALHNEVAQRLQGLHVVVVTVGGEDDLIAGGCFVGLGLVSGSGHAPGQVFGGFSTTAHSGALGVVAGVGSLKGDLSAGSHGGHKACHLLLAAGVIQQNLGFRHTGGDDVVGLRDDVEAGRCDNSLFFGSEYGGQNTHKHCQSEEEADDLPEHGILHFIVLLV